MPTKHDCIETDINIFWLFSEFPSDNGSQELWVNISRLVAKRYINLYSNIEIELEDEKKKV